MSFRKGGFSLFLLKFSLIPYDFVLFFSNEQVFSILAEMIIAQGRFCVNEN